MVIVAKGMPAPLDLPACGRAGSGGIFSASNLLQWEGYLAAVSARGTPGLVEGRCCLWLAVVEAQLDPLPTAGDADICLYW